MDVDRMRQPQFGRSLGDAADDLPGGDRAAVIGAIVIVVREPGPFITAIIDDPWTTISTIGLSGGIGWIFGWRAQRDD